MATIEAAMPFLLRHEGGLSNVAGDRGGKTNRGITQRSLDAFNLQHPVLSLPSDVADLSLENTTTFYANAGFWCYDGVVDQNAATKIFDLGVNFGDGTEVKMVQGILGATIDGRYGPATERTINATEPAHLINLLCMAAEGHYRAIVDHDPSQAKFLTGWLRRALDTSFA
jgi:lysozyme family protein